MNFSVMSLRCFHCGKRFSADQPRCLKCHWMVCPYCAGCYCQLGEEGKKVANAMWDSYKDYVSVYQKQEEGSG